MHLFYNVKKYIVIIMVYGEKIWILFKYFGYYMGNKYHSPELFWHDFIHFTTMLLTQVFNRQPKYRN